MKQSLTGKLERDGKRERKSFSLTEQIRQKWEDLAEPEIANAHENNQSSSNKEQGEKKWTRKKNNGKV